MFNTGPPPENGNGARQSAGPEKAITEEYYYASTEKINSKPDGDFWIQRYLAYLDLEIKALSGGPIAQHYRLCAEASYREFQSHQTEEAAIPLLALYPDLLSVDCAIEGG